MTILNKITQIVFELEKEAMFLPGDDLKLWVSPYFLDVITRDYRTLDMGMTPREDSLEFRGMAIRRMERPVLVGFISKTVHLGKGPVEIPIAYFDTPIVIKNFLEIHDYGQIPVYTFDPENPAMDYEMAKREKEEPIIIDESGSISGEFVKFKKVRL